MKSYLLLLLLGVATVKSAKLQAKMQELVDGLSQSSAQATHSCSSAITRWKTGTTVDYTKIVGSGTKFTDSEFPTSDAIYWSDYSFGTHGTDNIVWDRVKNRQTSATLFGSGPDPWGIKQQSLGDCYYMASCSASSETKVRITNNFLTQSLNNEGIIAFKGYVLGQQKTTVVDDYLPFWNYASTSKTLYYTAEAPDGAVWGPFMEKIYAKVNGNYEMIESGWMSESVRFLTGAPSYSYYVKNYAAATAADSFWSIANAGNSAGLIMTAGTPSATGGDTTTNAVGLAMSHAYSVIDTKILKNADGTQKARLFKMRNPWGSDGSYSGTWKDSDPNWNTAGQTYATQVGLTVSNDGVFYITVEDFIKYFDSLVVSHYHDGWQHSTSTVYTDNGQWKKFEFTLATAQEGFIGIDFYNARMYAKGCKTTSTSASLKVYNNGRLFDAKVVYDSDFYGFVYSSSLPAGTYQVYVKVSWQTNDVTDYTLRTYMASAVTITKTDFASDSVAFPDMAKNNQTTSTASTYLVSAAADTTTAYGSSSLTYATTKGGYWGSTNFFLYYWKITSTTTQWVCSYTISFSSANSGIVQATSNNGACTTAYDSTSNRFKHTCTCKLAKSLTSSCSYMVQTSGVSSTSISMGYGWSCASS